MLDNTTKLLYHNNTANSLYLYKRRMPMEIHDYITIGGKNLIKEYISTRPMNERRELYKMRHEIILNGMA